MDGQGVYEYGEVVAVTPGARHEAERIVVLDHDGVAGGGVRYWGVLLLPGGKPLGIGKVYDDELGALVGYCADCEIARLREAVA